MLLALPEMLLRKVNAFGPNNLKDRLKLGLQAGVASLLVLCYYEAMMRLELGDFGAIVFSSPVFTMIFSVFLLKDKCGVYRVIISIILVIGVVIISRPPALFHDDEDMTNINTSNNRTDLQKPNKKSCDVVGIVAALSGAILSAWATIIVK